MLLCIDAGNTQVHCGFYQNYELINSFRLNSKDNLNSDQLGIFLKSFCLEITTDVSDIKQIGISSVVPSLNHHLRNACLKYFNIEPKFIGLELKANIDLSKFQDSISIGADLICNAQAGTSKYPGHNLLVTDMGTATTIIAVSKMCEFITGIIMPGIKTQIDSLNLATEKLSQVEIIKPEFTVPKSTIEAIQMGVYYGHLGGIKMLLDKLSKDIFDSKDVLTIATGGHSNIFNDIDLFDHIDKNLTLDGLAFIMKLNL